MSNIRANKVHEWAKAKVLQSSNPSVFKNKENFYAYLSGFLEVSLENALYSDKVRRQLIAEIDAMPDIP